MTQRVLISGSVAYDTIMVFEGHFKDHILPDRVHMLNVSFLAPRLKREFGGCAANIAYNLNGARRLPGRAGHRRARRRRLPGAARRRWGSTPAQVLPLRGPLHRAGLHHHRPVGQPDHRLPPGGDERRRTGVGAGERAAGGLRHRRAERQARDAASTRASSARPACPSSSTRARDCRCSTGDELRGADRRRDRGRRQRLRERACWPNDRLERGRDRGAGRRR